MNADRYYFLPRLDDEDAVFEELEMQDVDFQQAFYDFVFATNAHGWDQREHFETLDNLYQTYVLMVGGDRTRRAMLTREITMDGYYYLGLTTADNDQDATEAVYQEACKAHRLVNPVRTPNPSPNRP